ncbi:MAG: hypothetical protein KF802_08580 [Bdellovibrionaceae bacterium]|nr:hypothetical protein [Pseudobdellovibrionaceae bacterium]
MKKQFIAGMLMISMTAPAFGAGMKGMPEYIKTVKEHVLGKDAAGKARTNAAGLAQQAHTIANDKIIKNFDLSSGEARGIRDSLTVSAKNSKEQVEARLENLASLLAARNLAKDRLSVQAEKEEAQSVLEATNAMVRIMALSSLKRQVAVKNNLTKAESDVAAEALDKYEALGEAVVSMNKAERDMYTKVALKTDELVQSGKFSPEEALVESIMVAKGVDKAKALEIVKKLKECV